MHAAHTPRRFASVPSAVASLNDALFAVVIVVGLVGAGLTASMGAASSDDAPRVVAQLPTVVVTGHRLPASASASAMATQAARADRKTL